MPSWCLIRKSPWCGHSWRPSVEKTSHFEQLLFAEFWDTRSTNRWNVLYAGKNVCECALHNAWHEEGRVKIVWFISGKTYNHWKRWDIIIFKTAWKDIYLCISLICIPIANRWSSSVNSVSLKDLCQCHLSYPLVLPLESHRWASIWSSSCQSRTQHPRRNTR